MDDLHVKLPTKEGNDENQGLRGHTSARAVDGRALHASPHLRKRERGCLKAQYRGSRRRR